MKVKKKKKEKVTFFQSIWMVIACCPVYLLFIFLVWLATMIVLAYLGVDFRGMFDFIFKEVFVG